MKGPASPRGSYILLTCDSIIRFVSGGVSFESLLGLSFCTLRFLFEKKLGFAEKHKWSLIGSQLTPSTFSVATFDSFGIDILPLLESREKIHSFSLNPPLMIKVSMSCINFWAVGRSVVLSIMSSIYVLSFTIFAALGNCSLPISAVLRKAIVAMVAEGLSPNETLCIT